MTESQPTVARPRNVRELESMVQLHATKTGQAVPRVRRSISFTVLSAMLNRVRAFDGGPAFMIKGGVALERRLTGRPRTTKDFDAVFRSAGSDLVDALDSAFAEPFDGWRLRRDGAPEALENGKALRVDVKLDFEGRSWGTVPVEVSDPEGAPVPPEEVVAFDLSQFGLSGPTTLACLPIRRQVAQKLHAMTAPPREGRENLRFRDLLDVWSLKAQIPVDAELRAECKQVFRLRRLHQWPPTITIYPSWPSGLERQASDEGLAFSSAAAIAKEVADLIAEIESRADRFFASSYGEVASALARNTDLRDVAVALVEVDAMPGKILEGASREARFRDILLRLVSGEIDLTEATSRTERFIGPDDSPHRFDRRVFPREWADRLIRTQYSRFYNQAVLESLIALGESRCRVPLSETEDPKSPCSANLAGRDHETRALLDALVSACRDGQWEQSGLKIPDHPHCTHVVAPLLADSASGAGT